MVTSHSSWISARNRTIMSSSAILRCGLSPWYANSWWHQTEYPSHNIFCFLSPSILHSLHTHIIRLPHSPLTMHTHTHQVLRRNKGYTFSRFYLSYHFRQKFRSSQLLVEPLVDRNNCSWLRSTWASAAHCAITPAKCCAPSASILLLPNRKTIEWTYLYPKKPGVGIPPLVFG